MGSLDLSRFDMENVTNKTNMCADFYHYNQYQTIYITCIQSVQTALQTDTGLDPNLTIVWQRPQQK